MIRIRGGNQGSHMWGSVSVMLMELRLHSLPKGPSTVLEYCNIKERTVSFLNKKIPYTETTLFPSWKMCALKDKATYILIQYKYTYIIGGNSDQQALQLHSTTILLWSGGPLACLDKLCQDKLAHLVYFLIKPYRYYWDTRNNIYKKFLWNVR